MADIAYKIHEFYSTLTRGNQIQHGLDYILSCVKPDTHEFGLLYRLVAHTRDYTHGLGERDLTYAMICVWYRYYPVHAIRALQYISATPGIGSWADIKYLCMYAVRTNDPNADKIIDCAIGLLNHRLNSDRLAWNNAMFQYLQIKKANPDTLVPRPYGRDIMSFAAKWAPREKSRCGWMFERMVAQWSLLFGGNVNHRAYRKMISMLNRELETVQVKQCAKRWADIEPDTVSVVTLLRQKRAFTNPECSEKFEEFYKNATILIPVEKFVSEALSSHHNSDWLNKNWSEKLISVSSSSEIIPIVDIGRETTKFSAIGGAILRAQAGPQRLMLACQTPVWIVATSGDSFMDIIDRIRPYVEHPTASNTNSAIELLKEASFVTGHPHEYIVLGVENLVDVVGILSAPRYIAMG
jgi:hypothetical protein